jgi:serine/threonine-protein kinase
VQLVGAVLNRRYRLTRPIGQGGMGLVYAGEVEGTRQPVAIKLLRAEFVGDEPVVARFLDEARIAARIVHPNVLRIFDVQRAEDGTPYLVMELLQGQALSSVLKTQARLPVAQAVTILQGVLAGLAAAHGQGVVHRDLKPDNVFLAHSGQQTFPKLLDFGIAKVMDAAGGMGNATRTGMLLGTPAYMSPEQIRNAKDVDARTDLWSAGVIFYEMITGHQAFVAPTEFARLAAVLGTQPDPIVSIDPSLAPWAAFIERALSKDRNLRFQSAQEMAQGLAACVPSPGSHVPETPVVMPAPARHSSIPPPVAPIAAVSSTGPAPIAAVSSTGPAPGLESTKPSAQPAGGTLASPSSPRRAAPGQAVVIEETYTGPESRATEGRRGIAPHLVAILVVLGLVAGFFMGYAVRASM